MILQKSSKGRFGRKRREKMQLIKFALLLSMCCETKTRTIATKKLKGEQGILKEGNKDREPIQQRERGSEGLVVLIMSAQK